MVRKVEAYQKVQGEGAEGAGGGGDIWPDSWLYRLGVSMDDDFWELTLYLIQDMFRRYFFRRLIIYFLEKAVILAVKYSSDENL